MSKVFYEHEEYVREPGYIRALGYAITALTIAFCVFMLIVVVSGLLVAHSSVNATQQALENAPYRTTEEGVEIPVVVVNPGLIDIDVVRVSICVETPDGVVLAKGEDVATHVRPGEKITLTPTLVVTQQVTQLPQKLVTRVSLDVSYAFNTIRATFAVEYRQEVA